MIKYLFLLIFSINAYGDIPKAEEMRESSEIGKRADEAVEGVKEKKLLETIEKQIRFYASMGFTNSNLYLSNKPVKDIPNRKTMIRICDYLVDRGYLVEMWSGPSGIISVIYVDWEKPKSGCHIDK